MDGATEKDCSPLWSLYQQIVSDMKNSAPIWEEFISKATKLHTALKSALVAIASFLDAFQKIADAATNARGATKDIGTALTRVCLRHRAIETRMKTFLGALADTLIAPLTERADEWRRAAACPGALPREHARECKRARAELRRRVQDAQRSVRKARRATATDVKRRADVCVLDVQERKQQLEEMEERAVKAAFVEERSRFCHFVALLAPVLECEVAMLGELGHLQDGAEQLTRHTAAPRSLPAASLQVICDAKSSVSGWCEAPSPPASRLGSRKSSLVSIASSQCDDSAGGNGSTVSCSTPTSAATSAGTLAHSDRRLSQSGRLPSVCSSDSGFRSQDALHRHLSLYADHGSDNQSVSSECAVTAGNSEESGALDVGNAASSTWPDLKDTAQFERAATAIMQGRPHTISASYERGPHQRPALGVATFASQQEVYARPPLPTRCSSLERPSVPAKTNANTSHGDVKPVKPSSLPPHLTKEIPQALYVNMSELATLAAARAQHAADHRPPQEKVCSESSASESSLESSSGYGSQGAFAAEDQALQYHMQHPEVVECEVVTLRLSADSVATARDNFSISLGSLEEAVRSLDETCESPAFATIGKKPAVPKKRPASIAASAWSASRRGSNASLGRPPPPVRRSSSISRPQRIYGPGSALSSPMSDADLPPPPAFLLQPDVQDVAPQSSVLQTVKQLNELRHQPASPRSARRLTPAPRGERPLYSEPAAAGAVGAEHAAQFSTFGPREPSYGVAGFKLSERCGQMEPTGSPPRRRPHSADRRASDQCSLIASLSAKLAPQLSPRAPRRAPPPAAPDAKGIGATASPLQPAFLDKLSATLQQRRRRLDSPRAGAVRELINHRAQPDPRACHTSLMEQIKRGATLKRNRQCNDRSAPKIR